MQKDRIDIEKFSREHPYKVPDGYFSDLNHRIMDRVEEQIQSDEAGGVWSTFRRMGTFAMGFAVMVIMATVGYYFTGHQASQNEQLDEAYYLISMYDVTIDDILSVEQSDSLYNQSIAQAAIEYLDVYGYGYYADQIEE